MSERALGQTAAERKWNRRVRRWTKRFALGGLMAGLAAGAWAFEAATVSPEGLRGILAAEAPSDLAAAEFEPLGTNWQQWSEETAQAIQTFYKLEGDSAAQRGQLAGLKSKLAVMDKAIKDSAYAGIHDTLMSLRGPLARRVAVAEALLDTLELDPQAARKSHLDAKVAGVSNAIAAVEKDVQGIPGGSAWLPYLKAAELKAALQDSASAEGTVAALNATKGKLAKRETLTDASQKEFLSRKSFLDLEAAVDAQLAAIAAPPAADNTPALRKELEKLVAALEEFESSSSAVAANDARATWKQVKLLAADGGDRLEAALGAHYFNFNVRIVASESFLSRLLSDARTESGQVSDYILGAAVGGTQTTSTTVGVDLKPAPDVVKFDLVLNGTVQSSTAGATSQATIYTSGYHVFNARKEVTFDGLKFKTSPGTIGVRANNTTTGATTRYSGGLFGGYAQRVAMQEAANRRPQAEAIAAGRIQDRVLPKFNAEVDKSFTKVGQRIDGELIAGLKATELFPDAFRYQSTDSALRMSSRLMATSELGGGAAEPKLLPEASGATLTMHESAVNNTIDRIGLAGKKMTEEELRVHLEGFLSKALSREFKIKPPTPPADAEPQDEEEKVPAKLVFAPQDPLRIQFRNGLMVIIIRAGLEREGKEPIPTQEITATIRYTVEGDNIKVTREELDIAGIDGDLSPVQRKVVNTKIAAALPERVTSGKFDLEGPARTVQAKVNRIQVVDGWISVGVE
jgi:hypothetical protein